MHVERMAKPKRSRVQFTTAQLQAMEKVFTKTQYPDVTVLEMLATRLDLGIEKVCTWFQNRRSKFRRESKKGHIDWMRQQLFTGREPDRTANAAAAALSSSPPGGADENREPSPEHVLSPINVNFIGKGVNGQRRSDGGSSDSSSSCAGGLDDDRSPPACSYAAAKRRTTTIPSPPGLLTGPPSDCFSLPGGGAFSPYPSLTMTPPMTPHHHMTLPGVNPDFRYVNHATSAVTTSSSSSGAMTSSAASSSISGAASRLYDYTSRASPPAFPVGSYGQPFPNSQTDVPTHSWSQYYNPYAPQHHPPHAGAFYDYSSAYTGSLLPAPAQSTYNTPPPVYPGSYSGTAIMNHGATATSSSPDSSDTCSPPQHQQVAPPISAATTYPTTATSASGQSRYHHHHESVPAAPVANQYSSV